MAVIASPLTAAVAVSFDLLRTLPLLGSIAGLACIHLILMQVVRDRGVKVQAKLWSQWGGSPTMQRMRWRAATSNVIHAELHRRVSRTTGAQLPTRRAEQRNPARADEIYAEAIRGLREARRDYSNHPRVFSELVSYGFSRNLYACKAVGVVTASAVTMGAAAIAGAALAGYLDIDVWRAALVFFSGLAVLILWLGVVRPDWVRRGADRYAIALLDSA